MLKLWREQVGAFFFKEETPYGIALIRIMLPIVLLFTIVHRWPYARELYSVEGAPAQLSINMGNTGVLPELSGNACVWLFTLLVITLVTSSMGWCMRFSLFTSLILFTYFSLMDSLSTITKYSVIADHMLLILALSPCGKVWSVDAWLKNRGMSAAKLASQKKLYPAWNRRLIQIMIGIVYFGAGATKLQTPTFFNGDQMKFWMVTHFNYDHPFGELMVLFPGILAVGGFIILVWELSFIFLVWRKYERQICLGMGVFFHLMTSFMLGLYTFPCVCYSSYLSFFTTNDLESMQAWWQKRVLNNSLFRDVQESFVELKGGMCKMLGKVPVFVWNPLMLGILIPAICTGGLLLEHKLDRFGLRRAEGRYQLKKVDPQLVQQMLQPSEKLRESDKIFAFNVGVVSVCDNVMDCRPVFSQGTRLLAQAALTPPHGDVLLECNLHTEQGGILTQVQKFVAREESRATFMYQLCNNTKPGKYDLVLKCNGVEVERRRIEVRSNGEQPKEFSLTSR